MICRREPRIVEVLDGYNQQQAAARVTAAPAQSSQRGTRGGSDQILAVHAIRSSATCRTSGMRPLASS